MRTPRKQARDASPYRSNLLRLAALSGAVLVLDALAHEPRPPSALLAAVPLSDRPSSSQSFADARRWLESLRSRQELLALAAAATTTTTTTASPHSLHAVGGIARLDVSHLPGLVAKLLLQWSLALFLLRARALSKPRAASLLGLSALVLAASVVAHSTVSKLLAHLQSPPTSPMDASAQHLDTLASLLNALFLARHSASAAVNAALARGYHVLLCAPWPSQWRRVPKYLGSADLVLSTLFGAAAAVALASVSVPELRALSEAAARIEGLALGLAALHLASTYLGSQPTQ